MFNQDPGDHVFQVENTGEGEDGELQREAPLRSSRRRFRKVNHRGERELITDGQDAQGTQAVSSLSGTSHYRRRLAAVWIVGSLPWFSAVAICSGGGGMCFQELHMLN